MILRIAVALAFVAVALAQQKTIPELRYRPVPGWPQLPTGWNLEETSGVAADSRGHVYVFNRGQHPLMEFESSGKFVRSWGEGMFTRTHGVRVDREGNIWVVDVDAHTVLKMNPEGRVVMVLGRKGQPGTDQAHFNRPTDVAVAPSGEFYVSDGYVNSRVVKFSREGNVVREWGKKGAAPGEFNLPHTVVLDAKGRVYVGDRENRRVQVFDPDGKFLTQWTHAGSPWGLDITSDQRLWLADGYNNRVLLLNLEGQVLGSLGGPGKLPGQFAFAHALAAGPNGELYVAEILNWRVQKFVQ